MGTLGTLLSFGDLLWRLTQFASEIIYHRDKYDNNRQIVELTFSGCSWTAAVLVIQIFTRIYTGNFAYLCGLGGKCFVFGPLYCLLQWYNSNSLYSTTIGLRKSRGLDCGTSLANSFFYGYLNIILANKGDAHKGIVERIQDFESTEHIEIPVKKLFILLPKSLYSHPLFNDCSENIIKIHNLEFVVRDRAGTTNRHYSNTVYKLLPKKYYVVAEAATPLLTFYETIKNNGDLKCFSPEVFDKFYHKLQNLLNSCPACRNLVVLVPYSGKKHQLHPSQLQNFTCPIDFK